MRLRPLWAIFDGTFLAHQGYAQVMIPKGLVGDPFTAAFPDRGLRERGMTLFSDSAPAAGFDLTGDPFIDSLFAPEDYFRTKWATVVDGKTQVSYSFPFLNGVASKFTSDYGPEPKAAQHSGVTNAQIAGIDLAFQRWADVANVRFTEVTETAAGVVGDIRIAYSSSVSGDSWGYTKIISDGSDPTQGDIWIAPDIKTGTFQPFTYDFVAMMHEIGHALGLDHPFEGNIIPDGYDDVRYTIMSYTDPKGVFFFKPGSSTAQYIIQTPGVYDIAAVQRIYGANMSFHTGKDVYAFKPDQPVYQTIWDAGGIDTLDVSAFTKGCSISLVPGTYSLLAYPTTTLDANIGIAFNCIIENAVGGAGNDVMVGNDAANLLRGGSGGDTISGGGGNDVIEGGAGNDTENGGGGSDTFRAGGDAGSDAFNGGAGTDTVSYAAAKAGVTVDLGAGTAKGTAAGDAAGIGSDTLASIEAVTGSAFADSLRGTSGADTFNGGAGNDTITGGSGLDTASYVGAKSAVTVMLAITTAQDTGGAGLDTLSGIENIVGSSFGDTLTGGAEANVLTGVAGSDRLDGMGGADKLIGGAGADFLTGGTGADIFRFAAADFGGLSTSTCDRILDFSHADGDRIDLSAIDANRVGGGSNDAFSFIGSAAFGNVAGQVRLATISGLTVVQGDTNGDGLADFWIGCDGAPALVSGDFLL